jgi:hypothetical protein
MGIGKSLQSKDIQWLFPFSEFYTFLGTWYIVSAQVKSTYRVAALDDVAYEDHELIFLPRKELFCVHSRLYFYKITLSPVPNVARQWKLWIKL